MSRVTAVESWHFSRTGILSLPRSGKCLVAQPVSRLTTRNNDRGTTVAGSFRGLGLGAALAALGALSASRPDVAFAQEAKVKLSAPRDGETLPFTQIKIPVNKSRTIR